MTKSFDRGGFVDGHEVTIIALANGTFNLRRDYGNDEVMGFSSAADMIRFLESEYSVADGKACPPDPDFAEVPDAYVVMNGPTPVNVFRSRRSAEACYDASGFHIMPVAFLEKDETE